jgi:hypothetical protein
MSIHTLDKANLINELQCGQNLGQAIHSKRRADFSLLLAMLSQDVRDNTPVESVPKNKDSSLRELFALPLEQQVKSDESSYQRGQCIAQQFNQGGLTAARLQSYLAPDALTYMPEHTHDLPEDIYHNLSGHQRRKLQQTSDKSPPYDFQLYHDLVVSQRKSELYTQL